MPFYKTYEVSKSFFDEFLKEAIKKTIQGDNREHPMVAIPLFTGETEDFMVRYYNRSGESSVEDVMEYYPSIVIQDFQPELDKSKLWGKDYIEGVIDEVSGTRELITLPVPLMYRFQVSVVTRRLKEVQSANDWFFDKFSFHRPDCFEFNKIETEEGIVADIVPYMVEFNQVPREDRRFEYAYYFTLNAFVHAKAKKYDFVIPDGGNDDEGSFVGGTFEDMVQKIKFVLKMQDFNTFERIIQHNFELPE